MIFAVFTNHDSNFGSIGMFCRDVVRNIKIQRLLCFSEIIGNSTHCDSEHISIQSNGFLRLIFKFNNQLTARNGIRKNSQPVCTVITGELSRPILKRGVSKPTVFRLVYFIENIQMNAEFFRRFDEVISNRIE